MNPVELLAAASRLADGRPVLEVADRRVRVLVWLDPIHADQEQAT